MKFVYHSDKLSGCYPGVYPGSSVNEPLPLVNSFLNVLTSAFSTPTSSLSRASDIEEEVYEAMRGSGLLADLEDEDDLPEPDDEDDEDDDEDDENDEENEDDYEDVSGATGEKQTNTSGVCYDKKWIDPEHVKVSLQIGASHSRGYLYLFPSLP